MSEKTATVVAEVPWLMSTAKVYRLSEPIQWCEFDEADGMTEHVVASAVHAAWDHGGPEVIAWASNENGTFLAMDGRGRCVSEVRGEYRHDAALEELGFTVVPGDEPPRQLPPTYGSGEPLTREDMEAFNRELRESLDRLRAQSESFKAALREAESE